MEIARYRDVDEFWRAAESCFTGDPVRNTVALTVVDRLRQGVSFGDGHPRYLTLHECGELRGAVLRTPPHPMLLSGVPAGPMTEAVAAIHHDAPIADGIAGLRPEIDVAASTLRSLGVDATSSMAERLYRLGALKPPSTIGSAREASHEDIPLLARFREDFEIGAFGERRSGANAARTVRDGMTTGQRTMLWEVDGLPVAMAAVSPPILGMSRIGPVYTPPEHRGNGYGSAVTAAITVTARTAGAREILLFTDLSNRTANAIYRRIGYEPVCDAAQLSIGEVG